MVMVDWVEVEQFVIVESFVEYEVFPKLKLIFKIDFIFIQFTRGAIAATLAASL